MSKTTDIIPGIILGYLLAWFLFTGNLVVFITSVVWFLISWEYIWKLRSGQED